MKKIDNYGLNYHRYRVQPLVLCTPTVKKIIYDLTFAIVNKCFEFQNDMIKIIPIR